VHRFSAFSELPGDSARLENATSTFFRADSRHG
jgi:hypothetical protein